MILKQKICFGQKADVLAMPPVTYRRDVMIRAEFPSGAFPVAFGVLA
jgi:hypothetical protein